MEEVGTPAKGLSSDSFATSSKDLEDLGFSSPTMCGANGVVESKENMQPLPVKIEIGSNGKLADLQVITLDESLNDATQNSNGVFKSHDSDLSLGCKVFKRIFYLGSAPVNGPRSDIDFMWIMKLFNRKLCDQINEISLSIPPNAGGYVILYEAESSTEIARYPINRIIYLARGPGDTPNTYSFAFTCPRKESEEKPTFECHVFRCEMAEVFPEVMRSLFHASHKPEDQSPLAEFEWDSQGYTFLELIHDNRPYTPQTESQFKALCAEAAEIWKRMGKGKETIVDE